MTGCRTAAIVPAFPAAAGYRPPLRAPRQDTATVVPAPEHPTTPQRRSTAEVRNQAAAQKSNAPREQTMPMGKAGRRYAQAAPGDTARNPIQPTPPRGLRRQFPTKLFSAQTLVHYSLHFLFPAVLALVFFPLMWQTAYLIMLATMLMDLDHLLAKPIFDPLRCSIGYHPLHSFYAVPIYALLLLLPATQIVAVGLLFHLFTDTVDCLWNFSHCQECYLSSRIYALRNWVRKLLGREGVE
ncbi:hypothetical protein J0X19_21245 [Hymenobacter sp. BT186]|uniref:Uncharacterized protein n=1 Tax=Hymenobacter telluris TaxID=2816474 RepID=A0A939F0I0_9BACT|nr:DUF6122 family protein [Hymenobacter telluris]MBO0360501.1 hypothetical protein [Hymenobacter telluris]MBW3376528.1 hypothetical protein [Hymenobacter norwichensis]